MQKEVLLKTGAVGVGIAVSRTMGGKIKELTPSGLKEYAVPVIGMGLVAMGGKINPNVKYIGGGILLDYALKMLGV